MRVITIFRKNHVKINTITSNYRVILYKFLLVRNRCSIIFSRALIHQYLVNSFQNKNKKLIILINKALISVNLFHQIIIKLLKNKSLKTIFKYSSKKNLLFFPKLF